MAADPNTSAVIRVDQPVSGTNAAATSSAGTALSGGATPSHSGPREYQKGNWTLHETLVLINAKKMDDERRTKGGEKEKSRTAELRWKWVENYCWKNGCLRSQNQCNDKWDNLLRDYKKVREYEAKSAMDRGSYWQMEKHERKEINLPSNLLLEVFEALTEVVGKRYQRAGALELISGGYQPPVIQHKPTTLTHLGPAQAPPAPAPSPPHLPPVQRVSVEMSDSSDTERSQRLDSEAKRRKVRNLGPSIVQSASVLAQTLLDCEDKKEKRHRDVLEMEERKLQMEENRTEMSRQGFAGLISAVNNLSGAIHALVSDRNEAR